MSYFTTDGYGYVDKNYTYDVFGGIIEGDLSGKQNYGYRDYTPKVARFTTVDPIRDGENWVTYCNNDFVNHVDLDGLMPQAVIGAVTGALTGG